MCISIISIHCEYVPKPIQNRPYESMDGFGTGYGTVCHVYMDKIQDLTMKKLHSSSARRILLGYSVSQPTSIWVANCKIAVSPVWRYCSLALDHRYHKHTLSTICIPVECAKNNTKLSATAITHTQQHILEACLGILRSDSKSLTSVSHVAGYQYCAMGSLQHGACFANKSQR